MKFRNVFIGTFFICILSVTASQVGRINAVYNSHNPITGPVTSPITPTPTPIKPPITPAITSPLPTPPVGRPSPCGNIGDINGDKVISNKDSQDLLLHIVGLKKFTLEQKIAADVNRDGKRNVADAISIQQYASGKINTFPACNAPTSIPVIKYSVGGKVTHIVTSSYKISGKIYKYSRIVPVQNATISIVNIKTKQLTSVKTNRDGKYTVLLNKGEYSISASNAMKTIFTPVKVTINLQRNMPQVNFQGR